MVSGAFFCTAAQMPLLAGVRVQFGSEPKASAIPAFVIRAGTEGFGLEWADLAPAVIARLLTASTTGPAAGGLSVEHPHPDVAVPLAADRPSCKVLLEEIKVLLAQLD